MKPLFIPLKTEYFNAFKSGEKFIEYRAYGPRWNEKTCPAGRRVVLSKGYGKHERITGVILAAYILNYPPDVFYTIYPCDKKCFGIGIAVDHIVDTRKMVDQSGDTTDMVGAE